MRRRRGLKLLALLFSFTLVAAACGDDEDDAGGTTTEGTGGGDVQAGGEFIDLGTIVGDPLEFIDPALNTTYDGMNVTNNLYDGLTEWDFSDPENPELKGLVAESWEGNDDATVFTFKIKDGLQFSDGTPVLPSSFQRAWERGSDPDFAGDYSYLFNFLKGGAEKLDGKAETIEGIKVDDEAMTLETTLAAPYANWPTVAGFQLFWPMPEAVDELDDQKQWDRGLMIGNGPYKLEKPRTDQEIVLVKNDLWAGDVRGEKHEDRLDKITYRTSADPDASLTAMEAGEGHNANVAPGRWGEVKENFGNTIRPAMGTRYFEINWKDPLLGGKENTKLRQAINLAVNRQEISDAIYDGTNPLATSLLPPGIAGYQEGVCEFCKFDLDEAKRLYAEWQSETGKKITDPIKINFNADAGHEPVVAILIDNLKAAGIPAVADPYPGETYFSQLADGACQICRSGWYADYPTYDNFSYDLFHSDAVGANNHSYFSDPHYDELIDQAKAETDEAKAIELYQEAEDYLLNEVTALLPYLYYALDYAYDEDRVAAFPVDALGLVQWPEVRLKA